MEAKFGSPIIKISSKDVSEQFLINKEGVSKRRPGILVIYSPGCIHCKNMEPEFIKGAKQGNGVQFMALNGKLNKRLAGKMGIQSFPTILKIKNGFITPVKFENSRTATEFTKFALKN